MKNVNYSIRISELMAQYLVDKARERQMLPSEYLRYIIQQEMDREGYYSHGKTDQ